MQRRAIDGIGGLRFSPISMVFATKSIEEHDALIREIQDVTRQATGAREAPPRLVQLLEIGESRVMAIIDFVDKHRREQGLHTDADRGRRLLNVAERLDHTVAEMKHRFALNAGGQGHPQTGADGPDPGTPADYPPPSRRSSGYLNCALSPPVGGEGQQQQRQNSPPIRGPMGATAPRRSGGPPPRSSYPPHNHHHEQHEQQQFLRDPFEDSLRVSGYQPHESLHEPHRPAAAMAHHRHHSAAYGGAQRSPPVSNGRYGHQHPPAEQPRRLHHDEQPIGRGIPSRSPAPMRRSPELEMDDPACPASRRSGVLPPRSFDEQPVGGGGGGGAGRGAALGGWGRPSQEVLRTPPRSNAVSTTGSGQPPNASAPTKKTTATAKGGGGGPPAAAAARGGIRARLEARRAAEGKHPPTAPAGAPAGAARDDDAKENSSPYANPGRGAIGKKPVSGHRPIVEEDEVRTVHPPSMPQQHRPQVYGSSYSQPPPQDEGWHHQTTVARRLATVEREESVARQRLFLVARDQLLGALAQSVHQGVFFLRHVEQARDELAGRVPHGVDHESFHRPMRRTVHASSAEYQAWSFVIIAPILVLLSALVLLPVLNTARRAVGYDLS